nr:transmembrane protein [Ipomoea batatas]
MAVQRQTAASRSDNPAIKLQHGNVGGVPTTTPTNPPSKFAHTPNFKASLGHLPAPPPPLPSPVPPPPGNPGIAGLHEMWLASKAIWNLTSTVIENQAKSQRHIEINTKNIESNGGAKANRRL